MAAEHNQAVDALTYAQRHLDVRMKMGRKQKLVSRHGGLVYTELGLGLLLNERYQEAIDVNRAGKSLLVQLPLFKEGKYWPNLAVIHEILALI